MVGPCSSLRSEASSRRLELYRGRRNGIKKQMLPTLPESPSNRARVSQSGVGSASNLAQARTKPFTELPGR